MISWWRVFWRGLLWSAVISEKVESRWPGDERGLGSGTGVEAEEVASWLWMFSILELKNDIRLLHFSEVNEVVVVGLEEFIYGRKQGAWVGGSRVNDARVVNSTGFV